MGSSSSRLWDGVVDIAEVVGLMEVRSRVSERYMRRRYSGKCVVKGYGDGPSSGTLPSLNFTLWVILCPSQTFRNTAVVHRKENYTTILNVHRVISLAHFVEGGSGFDVHLSIEMDA